MTKRTMLLILVPLLLLVLSLPLIGSAEEINGFNTGAFASKLESNQLSLERVDLPGTEDISWVKWLSVSPKGSYLIGAYEDGYGVYYVTEEVFIPLTFDTTGDEYGNLERFSQLALPKYLSFVWSPNERYFAVVNRQMVVVNNRLEWDLFVGDLTTNTFRALETWSNKLRENGGAVYQACFDQSCEKLYYSLYGYMDNPFDSKFFTVEHDIATGESRPLCSNEWTDENGYEYSCAYDGMHCLSDGRILQIAVRKDSKDFGLSIMMPTGDNWERRYLSIANGDDRGNNFQFCMVEDDFLTFTYFNMLREYEETLYISLIGNNPLASGNTFRDYDVGNTQLSPDGKYVLSLMHSGSSYSLEVLDRTSKGFLKTIVKGGAKVSVPFDLRTNGAYLLGHNSFATEFIDGIQWGGNILLLGTKDGVKVYRFEDVENPDSYPLAQ